MMDLHTRVFSTIFVVLFALSSLSDSQKINKKYGHPPPLPCPRTAIQELRLSDLVKPSFSAPVEVKCNQRVTVNKGGTFTIPGGLKVDGELVFEDGGSTTTITTPYILVQGRFIAGSETKPFKSKINIIITDSSINVIVPNRSGNPLFNTLTKFGNKAFVVYGGSFQVYGHVSGPTFTHLVTTAVRGESIITVKGDMSKYWKANDQIVIAPHHIPYDYQPSSLLIEKVVRRSDGDSDVFLQRPIDELHAVRRVPLENTTPNGMKILAPEVAKINRQITIRGMPMKTNLDEWVRKGSKKSLGGHFVIANSPLMQVVQGIEFVGMGQTGISGRYPLHVHFGGNAHPKSRLTSNSIHHSTQRCVVIHATHDLLIEKNVAYQSRGHCFITEDGIERGNQFIGNIGISIREAKFIIFKGTKNEQSDDANAVFWMASPSNDLINNVAAGSPNFGIWYQLFPKLRGQSRDMQLPGWRDIDMSQLNFGTFKDNTAHSCGTGLATYPDGSFPVKDATFDGLFTWTTNTGWMTNIGKNQILKNAVILDVHSEGIFSHTIEGHRIQDTVIGGELIYQWECKGGEGAQGIHMEAEIWTSAWYDGLDSVTLDNVHFQTFSKKHNCRKNYGIYIDSPTTNNWFASASSMKRISFSDVDQKLEVKIRKSPHRQVAFMVDGVNFNGVNGKGYMVSNGFPGESVLAKSCKIADRATVPRMLFCKNQCWRHVSIAYKEMRAYKPTSLRITHSSLGSFVEKPTVVDDWVGSSYVNRLVTKIVPSGRYDVEIVDKDGKVLPKDKFDVNTFEFIRPDVRIGPPACKPKVNIFIHGKQLFESV